MNPVSGYSIAGYGAMVADTARVDAYATALRGAVTPESVVLDIGSGIGIFSLLACRFGARHVYAVEPDDSIHTARALAEANGYADRITFIQDVSTRIELPERAHVIVSDLRGALPFYETNIPSIADARARHLRHDGILIPQRDTVWACPVEEPELYDRHLAPWDQKTYGLDFSSQRGTAVNALHRDPVRAERLLAQPVKLACVDYRTVSDPNVHASLEWAAERAGTVHGFSLWFSSETAAGAGYASGPGKSSTVYGMLLALLTQPVDVATGDRINAEFGGNLVNGKYVWRWRTRICEGSHGALKADFSQSTFEASNVHMRDLRKRASGFVPRPGPDGEADRLVLNMMDGKTSLESIARALTRAFPEQYPTWEDALGAVGRLSAKYSL